VAYFSNSRGTVSFDGTRGPWANDSTVSGTLKALADFLAGEPSNSSGAVIVRGDPERGYRYNSYDGWAHDTIQLTKSLSVNLGVRYTYGPEESVPAVQSWPRSFPFEHGDLLP
jgi:outer membrane receptor for monomeric catechols